MRRREHRIAAEHICVTRSLLPPSWLESRKGICFHAQTRSLPKFCLDAPPRNPWRLPIQAYQTVCFPVYEIHKVDRSKYVIFDRHKLRYLNGIERLNCIYCSYFNGVIAFVREVAARNEQYWCPIRHALRARGTHARHVRFLPYGDEEKFHERLEEIRTKLRQENS